MPTVFNQGYLVYLQYNPGLYSAIFHIPFSQQGHVIYSNLLYQVSYAVHPIASSFPPRLYLFGIHSRKLVCMRSKEKEEEGRWLRRFFLKKKNFS